MKYLINLLLFLLLNSCSKKEIEIVIDPVEIRNMMVDKNATDETTALFYNLKTLQKRILLSGSKTHSTIFTKIFQGLLTSKRIQGKM
ncbi:MAG: hypothetical protein IPO33_05795 [Saprospiraceae bacterium]|nr:hypothetical protein [Candidatus Brachybacter algidus]